MESLRPLLTVFAGPNGSGKSSLTRHLQMSGYDLDEYINPDEIATTLAGSYMHRVREAQSIADTRRAEAIAARRSFTFETVFSHPSKLDVLDQARRADFDVSIFFVGVDDPLINIERVRTRVHLGGHDVPWDRVISRYHRTMALLPEMLMRVDRGWIFDNTVRAAAQSEFAGRLVASVTRDDEKLVVTPRYPLPDWAARYLVAPLTRRPSSVLILKP